MPLPPLSVVQNELVFDGAPERWPLPGAILAFFTVDGAPTKADDAARLSHRNFLREFGISAERVPLLKLRPRNWQAPFAVDTESR